MAAPFARAKLHVGAKGWCRKDAKVSRKGSMVCRAASDARKHRVTLLPGDGIGPEITEVAVEALQSVGRLEGIQFEFERHLIGGASIDEFGVPLSDDTLDACRASDAVLLAAIGGYKWDTLPQDLRPERGLLGLRSGLESFANLRPAIVLPQLVEASSLKREIVEGVDIMIVRELTGGIYFGNPRGFGINENGDRIGFNTMIYSEPEVDRIARVAFEIAQKRKGELCSVEKSNVLEVSQLWRDVVTKTGSDYPDVKLSHMYVDNAAMQIIRNPKQFDTMVTGNIFGDILSDAASMLTGSLGMLPSASIGSGKYPGVYEPVHGSAPDIAGQDKANPLAQILSAAMMLRYGLNEPSAAERLEKAVTAALDEGYRTADLMSEGMTLVGCKKMGEVVLSKLES